MSNVTLKKNDLLPALTVAITDESGDPIDLTDVSGVKFSMRNRTTGAVKINAVAASILSPKTNGEVKYSWASGDTDTPGVYLAEFIITWVSGSKKQTAPQTTYLTITILEAV